MPDDFSPRFEDLARRQQMTHQAEQPNPAAPWIARANQFRQGGLMELLANAGVVPQSYNQNWISRAARSQGLADAMQTWNPLIEAFVPIGRGVRMGWPDTGRPKELNYAANANNPIMKRYADALIYGKITPLEFEGFMDALGVDKSMASRLKDKLLEERRTLTESVRNQLGARMPSIDSSRTDVLNKLIANRDFRPQLIEGRMWFRSLSPAENEVLNRIGWSRADNVTFEDEMSPERGQWAWEQNIKHWLDLAQPSKD